jgi:hypothetical protein
MSETTSTYFLQLVVPFPILTISMLKSVVSSVSTYCFKAEQNS